MKNICIIALLLNSSLQAMDHPVRKYDSFYRERNVDLNSLSSDRFYEVENFLTMKEFEKRKKLNGFCPLKRFKHFCAETLVDIQLFLNKDKYKIQ